MSTGVGAGAGASLATTTSSTTGTTSSTTGSTGVVSVEVADSSLSSSESDAPIPINASKRRAISSCSSNAAFAEAERRGFLGLRDFVPKSGVTSSDDAAVLSPLSTSVESTDLWYSHSAMNASQLSLPCSVNL